MMIPKQNRLRKQISDYFLLTMQGTVVQKTFYTTSNEVGTHCISALLMWKQFSATDTTILFQVML